MAAVRPTTKRHFSFKVGQRVPQPEEALDTLVARWFVREKVCFSAAQNAQKKSGFRGQKKKKAQLGRSVCGRSGGQIACSCEFFFVFTKFLGADRRKTQKKTLREHDALQEAESKAETDKLDALERVLAFTRKIEQTKQEITEEERKYHDLLAREETNTLLARSLVSLPPSSSVSSNEPLELRVARLRRLQIILGDLRAANSRLSALI